MIEEYFFEEDVELNTVNEEHSGYSSKELEQKSKSFQKKVIQFLTHF